MGRAPLTQPPDDCAVAKIADGWVAIFAARDEAGHVVSLGLLQHQDKRPAIHGTRKDAVRALWDMIRDSEIERLRAENEALKRAAIAS